MNKPRGLYIHVPFCLTKCPYCDFYSVPFSHKTAREYADAVIRNLERYDEPFCTVYFGGGTPILLAPYLKEILQHLRIESGAEITAEANPCMCIPKTLEQLRSAGVNRLSIGVQSLNDGELSALGRRHTAAQAEQAVLAAKSADFDNISADIMLAVPGQTRETLSGTISRLAELPLTHISAYLLKIEQGTPFGNSPPKMPDEDEAAALYLSAVSGLAAAGFAQYEISNFAKSGFESRHNLIYWRRGEYLGIGAAAHSFYNGKRFAVPRDIRKFIDSPVQDEVITDGAPNETEERIMLGLRLTEGIAEELWKPHEKRLRFIPRDYYTIENGRLSLTPRGFLLSNEIIALLTED
ncbi:MAG: radical SAM family heme chaperone HemW [Oscillospiraceae bacterium]